MIDDVEIGDIFTDEAGNKWLKVTETCAALICGETDELSFH